MFFGVAVGEFFILVSDFCFVSPFADPRPGDAEHEECDHEGARRLPEGRESLPRPPCTPPHSYSSPPWLTTRSLDERWDAGLERFAQRLASKLARTTCGLQHSTYQERFAFPPFSSRLSSPLSQTSLFEGKIWLPTCPARVERTCSTPGESQGSSIHKTWLSSHPIITLTAGAG